MYTLYCRFYRNVLNHDKAVPQIPYTDCSLLRKTSWSTVSKAAERSSDAKMVYRPRSILVMMSLVILIIAVSVEWLLLYADCKESCSE